MKMVKTIAGLLFLLLADGGDCDMECAFCNEAQSIDECLMSKITCGQNERCFLEKVTTTTLQAAYNAGCRSDTVCRIMETLSGGVGRRRRLINCAQCCTTNAGDSMPCNLMICGQQPSVTPTSQCLSCQSVASVHACQNAVVCQDDEICSSSIFIAGALPRYSFGCQSIHTCNAFIQHGVINTGPSGRANIGVEICSACCRGNRCNQEDCFTTRKNMTSLFTTIPPPHH